MREEAMEYKKVADKKWFIRMDKEDEIISGIKDFVQKNDIKGAHISGIGGLGEVEVGVFNSEIQQYETEVMNNAGTIEVVSLSGNLTFKQGEPFPHLHILVCAKDKPMLGGHLVRGEVLVTMEIWLDEIDVRFEREEVKDVGFWRVRV